jgi:hypothetical protein
MILLQIYMGIGIITGILGVFLLYRGFDKLLSDIQEDASQLGVSDIHASFIVSMVILFMVVQSVVLWPLNIKDIVLDIRDIVVG